MIASAFYLISFSCSCNDGVMFSNVVQAFLILKYLKV